MSSARASMLGSVKKRARISEKKDKVTKGSRESRAWRRMVIELALVIGTKQN